jgi:hypothetical protein
MIDENAVVKAAIELDIPDYRAREVITAYLKASPSPVGEVGELVKRLRGLVANETQPGGEADECDDAMFSAAYALTALAARLAVCEWERDEARNAAVESSGIAGEACIRAQAATARTEALERDASSGCRGGPTASNPNRPYCKPDMSCCDFVCGN